MEFFPLIPRNESEFKKIVCGIFHIYDRATYKDNNSREWFSPDLHVLSYTIKNFAENRNVYHDEQKGILLENELKKLKSVLLPTYKVYDYIVRIMNLTGVKIDPDQENYNSILDQPEFDFLREKNLLKKNLSRFMTETLMCYLIISYLHKNYNTLVLDERSDNFYENFMHYYSEFGFSEYGPENEVIKRLLKDPDENTFINFYVDLYKKISKFYNKWWCTRDLNLEEIIFLRNLKNSSDEIRYGTSIKINQGIISDLKYLYSQKSYKRKSLSKDFYNLYILCTETGTLYCTKISVCRNNTDNTIGDYTKTPSKKKKSFSANDLYTVGLGARLNVSGKVSHKAMIPLLFVKDKKSFQFEPVMITHVRFSLPKT